MLYKVKDLIAELSKFDPESYVGYAGYHEDTDLRAVHSIVRARYRYVGPDELGVGFVPCCVNMVVIDDWEDEE